MMTTSVAPRVTVLPPGPERPQLHFDQHLSRRTRYPVHAELSAEGFQSNGISFEDYSRMGTFTRKMSGGRREATPEWAINDRLLGSLVVHYLEARALLKGRQPGTEKERLQRAIEKLNANRDQLKSVLRRMCARYLEVRKSGSDPVAMKKLQEQIENYDTCIRINTNPAAIVIGVVHRYYRVGLDSVGVASELGLKPPCVRQIIWRLHREWKRIQAWHGPRIRVNLLGDLKPEAKAKGHPPRKIDLASAARLRDEGQTYAAIGKVFCAKGSSVSSALKRSGRWKPQAPKFDIETFKRLFNEGIIYTEIAEKLAITESQVRYYAGRLGLWRGRGRGRRSLQRSKVDLQIATTMFGEGATYREIGKAVGATPATVIYVLQTRGIWKPRHAGTVEIEVAARLFAQGKTYREMAKFFGVKRETVRSHLKKHGYWKPRPCGRRRNNASLCVA